MRNNTCNLIRREFRNTLLKLLDHKCLLCNHWRYSRMNYNCVFVLFCFFNKAINLHKLEAPQGVWYLKNCGALISEIKTFHSIL